MKVLLIAPPPFIEPPKRPPAPRQPPILLAYVAATLRAAGHEVAFDDAFASGASVADVAASARGERPGLCAIAVTDLERCIPEPVLFALARSLKNALPGMPLAFLGSRIPEHVLSLQAATPHVDFALLGEAEDSIVELADRLESGGDAAAVGGIGVRAGEGIVRTGPPRWIEDLDRLPFPAWDLVLAKGYMAAPHRYLRRGFQPILSTRGCPWNRCTFCQEMSVAKSPGYRTRSPENVVAEMVWAVRTHGAREVQFLDGHFCMDLAWLRRFEAALDEARLKIPWSCLARVDRVEREGLEVARRCCLWNLTFGLETASPSLLAAANKGTTVEAMARAVGLAKAAGIEVAGTFLIGIPGEAPSDARRTIRFARRVGLDYAAFFVNKWLEPEPPAPSAGTLAPDWEFSPYDFHGRAFVPAGYRSLGQMKRMQKLAYLSFYLRPAYILRRVARLRSREELARLVKGAAALLRLASPV